jgi:hypothetical protein
VAGGLRERASVLGIKWKTEQAYGAFIREAEWLASQPFAQSEAENRDRYGQALMDMEQAERIVAMLDNAPLVRNYDVKLGEFVRKINRLEAAHKTQALDHVMELEAATRLARFRVEVTLGEPDLIIRFPDGPEIVMACKRPESVTSQPGCIRSARDQVRRWRGNRHGLILIATERIFHGPTPADPMIHMPSLPTRDGIRNLAERKTREAIDYALPYLESAFRCGVVGVVYHGVMVGIARETNTFENIILTKSVCHSGIPGADALTGEVRDMLGGLNHSGEPKKSV